MHVIILFAEQFSFIRSNKLSTNDGRLQGWVDSVV